MSYSVVIPAAGMGKRMQLDYNKILFTINNYPIIYYTVQAFEADENCQSIYIAAKKEEIDTINEVLSDFNKVKGIFEGGNERQDSIYNVLKKMAPEDYIFVHDGARPFINQEVLKRLYEGVKEHSAVICGVKAKDTLKHVNNHIVSSTINRESVIHVHTPQAFERTLLYRAYDHAYKNGLKVTDDSMMIEALGENVHVVASTYDNIKITTPDDLVLAHTIMKRKSE